MHRNISNDIMHFGFPYLMESLRAQKHRRVKDHDQCKVDFRKVIDQMSTFLI